MAVALVGWFAQRWFSGPVRVALTVRAPRHVLEKEAQALRAEVDRMIDLARRQTTRVAQQSLKEDYASYGRTGEVRQRLLEEVEAIKGTAASPALLEGHRFAVAGGAALVERGFRFDDDALRPILQQAAATVREDAKRVQTGAVSQAAQVVTAALKDEYLSAQEEQDIIGSATKIAAAARTQARYPATVGGLTLSRETGHALTVAPFSFGPADVQQVLQAELNKRPGAVRERELVSKLVGLLKEYTQEDQILQEEERDVVTRLVTTPEPGKLAALPAVKATRAISTFCRQNNVNCSGPIGFRGGENK
jgi:hypothetical protein